MLIDKSIGNWCEKGESDDIDDIAFQLYLNYYYETYNSFSQAEQYMFMTLRKDQQRDNAKLYRFYKKAYNILRKLKLEKLENEYKL